MTSQGVACVRGWECLVEVKTTTIKTNYKHQRLSSIFTRTVYRSLHSNSISSQVLPLPAIQASFNFTEFTSAPFWRQSLMASSTACVRALAPCLDRSFTSAPWCSWLRFLHKMLLQGRMSTTASHICSFSIISIILCQFAIISSFLSLNSRLFWCANKKSDRGLHHTRIAGLETTRNARTKLAKVGLVSEPHHDF